MNQKILVIGGTGMLGKPVAMQLKKDGFEVFILSRNINDARIKMPANFEFIEGNVFDIESLKKAMTGKYGVYINLLGGPGVKDIVKTEWKGTENIVLAARESGIQKISLITGATVEKKNTWYPQTKAKYMAERAVIESGIKYIIFRPTWFMETLPKMIKDDQALIIGNSKKRYPWLSAADYAQMVSKAMMTKVADNKILPVAGPERLTIEEALNKYCNVMKPDVIKKRMSIGILKFFGFISLNKQLYRAASLFDYFEKVKENNDMDETSKILGTPQTTIENWLSLQKG